MRDYVANRYQSEAAPPHIHLAVRIEDGTQNHVFVICKRLPPACVFYRLSLLGSMGDMNLAGINWVSSGHRPRPMQPDWAREVRDLCVAAGGACFFKQWGGRGGCGAGGDVLGGKQWHDFPVIEAA